MEYTRELAEMVYQAIDASIKDLAPGTLSWGIGEAIFAKNRRAYGTGGVSNDFNPIGPVDHDVPVLLAKGADGVVRGMLFGYACHNTTLSIQEFNGDYAGFAQLTVEKAFPGGITEKLSILADAAKYDVSCSSSGSDRKNHNKGLGNASNGICHAYTEDGRCVSLLKILLTNHCIFDCAYCVSRKTMI